MISAINLYKRPPKNKRSVFISKPPGGVLKSMLASDIAIIDIEEYQIKHLKVVIKLL